MLKRRLKNVLYKLGMHNGSSKSRAIKHILYVVCLLYTSDADDEGLGVDLGSRRIIKKKNLRNLLETTYKICL